MNIFIITILIFITLYFNFILSDYNNQCKKDGSNLYETNLELKNNLLCKYSNNTRKIMTFLESYFNMLKIKSDTKSIEALNSQFNIIKDSLKCNRLIKHLTKKQIINHEEFKKELLEYKKMYILEYYTEEVFYYHHGLRFCSITIKNYINDKDIVDVGSFIGDSLVILQNYTKRKIHLYEFSRINIFKLKRNMKMNKINSNKVILHEKGLSNFTGIVSLSDHGHGGVGIGKGKGKITEVEINTLDNEFLNYKYRIGFIKVDIEGQGYSFILGAKNIIKQHRPVLSIAIYHNYDEYFSTRNLLESYVQHYTYEYHQFNNCEPSACEFSLFAYPNDI